MDRSKQLSKICARPDLSIKCSKSKKSCSCDTHEKRRKFKNRFSKGSNKFRRRRFFRKKGSFKKAKKQNAFYAEKKDTSQIIVQTNPRRRKNT
ncbi:hypothetical protein Bca4012_089706 [Brassica carinata]